MFNSFFYIKHMEIRLKYTIWDKYAEIYLKFLNENKIGPIILIIQFIKIKEWKGKQ